MERLFSISITMLSLLASEVVGPETRKMLRGLPPHLFRGEMNALADTQTTRRIVLIDGGVGVYNLLVMIVS